MPEAIKTYKAAKNNGLKTAQQWVTDFLYPRRDAIGVHVKDRVFFEESECEEILSRSEAGRRGMRLKANEIPVGSKHTQRFGRSLRYDVFRVSSFEQKPQRKEIPAQQIDLLLAIFTVNKSAKRYRDSAQSQYQHGNHGFAGHSRSTKEWLYDLKDAGIAQAFAEGLLQLEASHGGMAVYRGGGYCFHSFLVPEGVEYKASDDTFEKEASPKTAREARLKDAEFTLAQLSTPTAFERLHREGK